MPLNLICAQQVNCVMWLIQMNGSSVKCVCVSSSFIVSSKQNVFSAWNYVYEIIKLNFFNWINE